MNNLLQACRALIDEAYTGRFFVKIDPAKFERFTPAVEDTARLIDPDKVAIVMPLAAWSVLAETLAMDAESSHIDRALRAEIQAALGTIEMVQLLETPSSDEAVAAAFSLVADTLALSAVAVTP